jgi:hypothetical protein
MDYDALAKQFGGTKATAVDYGALAKELGGTTAPAAEMPGPRRTWADVASEIPTSVGPSAKRFVGGLVEAVTSPVKAVTALGDVLAGGLRAAVPRQVAAFIDQIDNPETTKRIESAAQAAGGAIKERYGGIEQLKNTIATDPVGAVADISLLLSGGGALVRGAGTAAKAAGATTLGAGAETAGRAIGTVADVINPITPVAKGAELALRGGATAAGNIAGFMRGERPIEQAAEIAQQAAIGRNAPDASRLAAVRAELAQAPSGVTGAQAAAGVYAPELQALGQAIGGRRPSFYGAAEKADEAARMAALQNVTPNLTTAQTAREAASAPLYSAAKQATITLDQPMLDLFQRMPKGTLEKAAEIARMEGRPFQMGQFTPAQTVATGMVNAAGQPITRQVPAQYPQMTGESLHYIKRALSDIANASPMTGITRDMQNAARGVLTDFLPQVESRIPAYGQARQTYAAMSEPVNQAQVLNELASVLQRPGGGERLTPFMNVLGRGEEAMLKRSTGTPRYTDISQVLTAPQLGVVRDVESQLARQASIVDQVRDGTTAANLIVQANTSNLRIPSFMNVKAHIANETLKLLQDRLNAKTLNKLEESFKDAKSLDDLLRYVPTAQRSDVLRALGQAQGSLSPAKLNIWAQTGNALAPPQESENALAR